MVKRLITVGLVGYFALFAVLTLAVGFRWHKYKKAPDQPIAFSHKVHVGKLGLTCETCHTTADKSTYAGVPSVQTCMNCHVAVKTDSPEIQNLTKYWEDEEPVPWNRVHRIRVRNYVYFTHEQHINAGVDCAQCHGDLGAMDKVRQVSSLKMGWCVSCHNHNDAPVDCLTCHK